MLIVASKKKVQLFEYRSLMALSRRDIMLVEISIVISRRSPVRDEIFFSDNVIFRPGRDFGEKRMRFPPTSCPYGTDGVARLCDCHIAHSIFINSSPLFL